jgi:hypothetical protein
MDEANAFLSGASVLASVAIGLFFLTFWRRSRDRFFAIFALAFFVFGANRLILVVLDDANENATYVYLVRLAAFVLILFAIVEKNRARSPGRVPS